MRHVFGLLFFFAAVFASLDSHARGLDLRPFRNIDRSVDHAADRAQLLIDQMRDVLSTLLHNADASVKARLEQLDGTVQDALRELDKLRDKTAKNVEAILSKYTLELQNLLNSAQTKLRELIEQAQCAAQTVLEKNLRDIIPFGGRLTIEPPVLYEGECVPGFFQSCPMRKEFSLLPHQFSSAYEEVRKYLVDERLNKADDRLPILSVLYTYELLASLSKLGGCLSDTGKQYFYLEYAKYYNSARAWQRLFGPYVGRVP